MNEFEKYLKYENVSPNTGDTYLIADRQYHKWYLESFGEEFTKLYRQNVLEFISYLKNIRNLKYESINVKIAALVIYNSFLSSVDPEQDRVVDKHDYLSVQTQFASPSTATEKDVDEFRQRVLVGNGVRDHAIATLICYTGLRISETVNLKLTDIFFDSREIKVVGKGDKFRTVYFNDKVAAALREYLKVRTGDSEYLFTTRQSEKISRQQVNRIFNKYSKDITPHVLRHFYCTNALEKGYSYHEVANQAGHSNINTTLRYTNPTAQKMRDKANKL